MEVKDNVVQFENPAKSIIEEALTGFIKESAQKMFTNNTQTIIGSLLG